MIALGWAGRGPLVGRSRECAVIDRWLAAAGMPVLEVTGEPGIGKTRLLAELAARAVGQGSMVLGGQATEWDRMRPLGVLTEAIDDHLARLGPTDLLLAGGTDIPVLSEVFPAFGPHADAGQAERNQLHRAIRRMLERLTPDQGLVVILDDIHWADDATVELLAYLFRRPPHTPLRLALGYRSRQVSGRLRAALALCADPTQITVGPLLATEADRLLDAELHQALRRRLYHSSGGNPFYLLALARAAESDPASLTGWDETASHDLPPLVHRALSGEFSTLTPVARHLAWAAAVAGDPFEVDLAAQVAQIRDGPARQGIDELVRRDLVRTAGDGRRLHFRHPLLRRMAYQDSSPGWRLGAHERAVAVLRGSGATPDVLARHVERVAHPGDRDAAGVLVAAARTMVRRAPMVAAHWLRSALRLLPESPAEDADRLTLLFDLARALCQGGDLAESRAVAHELLRLLPVDASAHRVPVVTFCAMVERLLGRHSEAKALLLAELARDPGADTAAKAGLLVELATGSLMRSDFPANHDWARDALELAGRHGEKLIQARALGFLAMGSFARGDVATATGYLRDGALLVDGVPDGQLAERVEAVLWLAWTEVSFGHYPDAVRHLERGTAVAHAGGQFHLLPLLLSCKVMAFRWLGRLPEAMECAELAVDVASLSGSVELVAIALTTQSWIASWTGDLDTARDAAMAAVRVAQPLESWFRASAGAMLAKARITEDPDGCVAAIVNGFGGPDLSSVDPWSRVSWWEVLVRAEVAGDRIDNAASWAARAQTLAAGLDQPCAVGLALLARAQVDAVGRDRASAGATALRAAHLLTEAGCRLDAARSFLLAGSALADRDAARNALRHAQDLFTECGAEEFARQARRAQRRLDARGSRRPAGAEPHNLTRREHEAAILVSRGLSNHEVARRMGVTTKTVEKHLGRVFAKLGVVSRAAVASAIIRAGDPA